MPTIPRILATTALCLAAVGVSSCIAQATPDNVVMERAEQQIRLQWQKNPKLLAILQRNLAGMDERQALLYTRSRNSARNMDSRS